MKQKLTKFLQFHKEYPHLFFAIGAVFTFFTLVTYLFTHPPDVKSKNGPAAFDFYMSEVKGKLHYSVANRSECYMVLMDGKICHYRWETEAYPEEYLDGIKSLKQMGEEGDSIIKPKGKNYFLLKKPGGERYLYIISEPAVDDSIRKLYY